MDREGMYPEKPEDVSRELSLYCDHLLKIPLQKETVVHMALYLSIKKSCSGKVKYLISVRVLLLSRPSGRKAAKHSWVSDSSNIAAVSNIPVQLFDHILGVQFCAIPGGQ
jgi:hypothetical protein